MALRSPRFAGNARLQQAANNAPALGGADCGTAVRLVQQALIDLGNPLPISTYKYGSPDGIYGKETKQSVRNFQTKYKLSVDGLAGKQTMAKLDELLPTMAAPLPPLPSLVPYTVPGIMDAIKQPTKMGCWATAYTMMINWKKQQSVDVRDVVATLGPRWLNFYDTDDGMSPSDTLDFARVAGLKFEPLQSLSVDGWAMLLRNYGPLWLSYGWEQVGINGRRTKKGRHVIVIRGLLGDGTPEGTEVRLMDPGNGMFEKEDFLALIAEYELGFTLKPDMSDDEMKGFAQILHF